MIEKEDIKDLLEEELVEETDKVGEDVTEDVKPSEDVEELTLGSEEDEAKEDKADVDEGEGEGNDALPSYTPDVLEEMNRLVSQQAQTPDNNQVPEREPELQSQVPIPQERVGGEVNFLDNLEDDVDLSDRRELNKLLNKVFEKAKVEASLAGQQAGSVEASRQIGLKLLVNQFWADNEDIAMYKDLVTSVAKDLVSKNPALEDNPQKLYKNTEIEFRKRYGLEKLNNNSNSSGVKIGKPRKSVGVIKEEVSSNNSMTSDIKEIMSDFI